MSPVKLAAFSIGLLLSTATAVSAQDVAVWLEGDGQMATCGYGTVVGLNPRGDNFLAVRTGPSTDYRKVDELHTGDGVHMCNSKGRWIGIVYGGSADACRIYEPPFTRHYGGPCRYGWVFDRYVQWNGAG